MRRDFVKFAQRLLEGFFADAKILPDRGGRTVVVKLQFAAAELERLDN